MKEDKKNGAVAEKYTSTPEEHEFFCELIKIILIIIIIIIRQRTSST